MKWNTKYIGGFILLGLFSVFFSLQSPQSIISINSTKIDSAVFQYVAHGMKQGLVPYVDMFDHKGPLIYWIDLLGISIHKDHGIWLLEIVVIFVSMLLAFGGAKLIVDEKFAFIAVMIGFLGMGRFYDGGNYTEVWALPAIFYALYVFIKYLKNDAIKMYESALCGIGLGCIFLLRMNMIGVYIGCILVILFLAIRKNELPKLLPHIIALLVGFVAAILPALIYLYANSAISECFEQYIQFNLSYQKATGAEKYAALKYFSQSKLTILAGIALLFLIYKKKEITISVALFTAYLVSLYLVVSPGRRYGHYAMVLIPILIYAVAMAMQYLLQKERVGESFLILTGIICLLVIPDFFGIGDEIWNQKLIKDYDQEAVIVEIEQRTTNQDLITVYGNKTQLYYLTDRKSASIYSYQTFFDEHPEKMQQYLEELSTSQPKLFVQTESLPEEIIHFLQEKGYYKVWEQNEMILYQRGY